MDEDCDEDFCVPVAFSFRIILMLCLSFYFIKIMKF